MITVSVFTPTLNRRPEMLQEAIDSVKAQTYPVLEHIIEIDDGKGQSRAMNDAMKKVKGDCFIFLADDDKLDPLFVERTVEKMERAQVDIVGTLLQHFGEDETIHGPGQFPFGTALCKTHLWHDVGGYDETIGPAVDGDFWFMCFEKGAKWSVVGEPLFKSRIHADQYSKIADWDQSKKRVNQKYNGKYG